MNGKRKERREEWRNGVVFVTIVMGTKVEIKCFFYASFFREIIHD
jgi:hypothetical protein